MRGIVRKLISEEMMIILGLIFFDIVRVIVMNEMRYVCMRLELFVWLKCRKKEMMIVLIGLWCSDLSVWMLLVLVVSLMILLCERVLLLIMLECFLKIGFFFRLNCIYRVNSMIMVLLMKGMC